MRRALASIAVLAFALTSFAVGRADTSVVNAGPVTLTAPGALTLLNLQGQASCAVSIQAVGATFSVSPQVTQDGTNWAIPSGISALVASTITNFTISSFYGFRLNATAVSGGTLTLSMTCSGAPLGGGSSSSSGTVFQGTIPWITTGQGTAGTPDTGVGTIQGITSGFPVNVAVPGNVTLGPGTNNIGSVSFSTTAPLPVSLSVTTPLPVTTPVPAKTDGSGNASVNCVAGCAAPLNGGATAQPTGAPAGVAIFGANQGGTLDSLQVAPAGTSVPVGVPALIVQGPNANGSIPITPGNPIPVPTASAGVAPPTGAGAVVAFTVCSRPGTISQAAGQFVATTCANNGSAIGVTTICGTASITTLANCIAPGPVPTASAGAAPQTTTVPVTSYNACSYNTGAIAVTNTNAIAQQCNVTGDMIVAATPNPAPFATMIATTAPIAVCAAACIIHGGNFTNNGASVAYCNIWNVAAASVTPGTTQPLYIIAVPATSTSPIYAPPTQGSTFGTAASILCTTTMNGGTAVAASSIWATIFNR